MPTVINQSETELVELLPQSLRASVGFLQLPQKCRFPQVSNGIEEKDPLLALRLDRVPNHAPEWCNPDPASEKNCRPFCSLEQREITKRPLNVHLRAYR